MASNTFPALLPWCQPIQASVRAIARCPICKKLRISRIPIMSFLTRSRFTLLLLLLGSLIFTACAPAPESETAAPVATEDKETEAATAIPEPEQTAAELEVVELAIAPQPVQITGTAEITFVLFDSYLTEPFVMLEDTAGFVNRDFEFELSLASQTIGPLIRAEDDCGFEPLEQKYQKKMFLFVFPPWFF